MAGAFFQIGGKMKTISIDVESYSGNDLGKCGVYKYVQHPDFDILLFGYAVDGGAVRVVDLASGETLPEEVLAALENAQCADILEKLPQGADTVIGTKGVYLSGGEQQRIAIARVMLKNAPVVILDEATAFADPDNESRVQAAFSKLSQGKTVIMIAHRLSTVAGVDQIYVIEDGQITESGKSRELLEKGGVFSHMWQDYQTSVQWKVAKEVQ